MSSGLTAETAKFATIGIGVIMLFMTVVSIPMMDRTGRRTLHLYGLGGMFIFSIFITISFLIKVRWAGKPAGRPSWRRGGGADRAAPRRLGRGGG